MSSYNFKVVLLGQGCVGKTSLVLRYVSNVFNERHESTLQASFMRKQLYLEQNLVKLNIWDTAGQEKFHALGPIYYRESNGALLVYDVTSPDSLRKVRDWVKELNKMLGNDNIKLAIIGNKVDLLPVNEQSNQLIQEAIQFTNELSNARHYLTSAKLNQGIGEMFISLAKRMVEQTNSRLARARDNGNSSVTSRILRSLAVTDDESTDRTNLPRPGSRVNLSSASNKSSPSSCICWS